MIKRVWMVLLIPVAVSGLSGIAQGGLITIGTANYNGKDYRLICEDDQGLIWQPQARLGQTRGPGNIRSEKHGTL